MLPSIVSLILIALIAGLGCQAALNIEDIHMPADCEQVASPSDHILLEYQIRLADGTISHTLSAPDQLYHILLDQYDDKPVVSFIKGMCNNSTRRLTWSSSSEVNLSPLFIPEKAFPSDPDESLSIDLRVAHITSEEDYEIFSAFRLQNISRVLELIDLHKGVNAFDEWGQTPLMIAVQMQRVDIIAALLNTRKPKVDVNAVKTSGITALFYAVQKATPTIVSALLKRGADPNVRLLQEGSRGNTPLHFACLLEKTKQAELLLEYGARPDAVNQYNQTPLQMLPRDAVPSTKLAMKKMFEEAFAKLRPQLGSPSDPSGSQRNDL